LLQPHEELLRNGATAGLMEEASAPKLKKTMGKLKVEGMVLIPFKTLLIYMGITVSVACSFLVDAC